MQSAWRVSLLQNRRLLLLMVLSIGMMLLAGCSKSDAPSPGRGTFLDSPVSGLAYTTSSRTGTTDADGKFIYLINETLHFSIGGLALGSAKGKTTITPLDIVAGAADASDQRVTNILVFLQTLDQDGDLNNGIQITPEIAAVVAGYAAAIDFDQAPAAFAADANVLALLAELNAGNVFTDTDPRPRTLRGAVAAQEHFARSISERKIVRTQYGRVSGYAANATTWQWLGIPYGKPPIGDLRWKPPQEPESWTGVRNAVAWSDQAAQDSRLQKFGEGGMSEDCLYLNVTAPKNAAKLPVMVWFHGGGFTALTSNTKPYNNPDGPTTKGVVLVTVNQRLGVFGYIAHPWLSAESGYNGSGNYGQMDLVLALQWVKNNIANFGGNPGNISIYGESGGGRKVWSLTASPQAAGLFHKAISQSGTLRPDTRTLATAEAIGVQISNALGVNNLAEMRAKSWTEIMTAITIAGLSGLPYTNVDNYYLPTSERDRYETHQQNDVPFMIMVTNYDHAEPIETWKNVFPWATDNSAADHFACLFAKVPDGWAARGVLAYHGCELTYVFNYPESVINHYLLGLVIDPATGRSLLIGDLNGNGRSGSAGDTEDIFTSSGWSATDWAVADLMMTAWTNFAKTGNPSTATFTWPVYTKANDKYVELGTTLTEKTGQSVVFP